MYKVKVSIGIPIYYGETYLKETLENIIAQDFDDYEVIITDNNPGGEPEKIAINYSSNYDKIRYIKHEKKYGALYNWNSCIKNASGEYFIFAGAHDLWSANFLSQLVYELDRNNAAVLAYAPSYFMKAEGEVLSDNSGFVDTSNQPMVNGFNMVFWSGQEPLYGLIRMKAINNTRLQKDIVGSGAVWISELSLYGNFVIVPTVKRYRRINRKETSREERLSRYYKTLFSKRKLRCFPFVSMYFYFLGVALLPKVKFVNRCRIFVSILTNYPLRYGLDIVFDFLSIIKRLVNVKK